MNLETKILCLYLENPNLLENGFIINREFSKVYYNRLKDVDLFDRQFFRNLKVENCYKKGNKLVFDVHE